MQTLDNAIRAVKKVRVRDVARYALLPGIIPRLRAFANKGFSWLAALMATIYASVRLLPAGHPYLDPANTGRFGIRHVIVEAAHRLVLKKENIDQLIIFFALLIGLVLLMMQVGFLLFGFLISPAFAAIDDFAGLFATPNPQDDIAFLLLDKVFAVPGMFGSGNPALTPGTIPGFNRAMQELFQYYNYLILIVGVFVFLYYVLIVVGETAQSGTPFGRRFAHIWAPMRLVAAVGLLVPLSYGFNSAQYIVLHAAKYGSGFATNAWIYFVNTIKEQDPANANAIGATNESLVAEPSPIDGQHIVSFMAIVGTCAKAYHVETAALMPESEKVKISAYHLYETDTGHMADDIITGGFPAYADLLAKAKNKDIVIVFGEKSDKHQSKPGNVNPYCGQITVHTSDVVQPGALRIQEWYYTLVASLANDALSPGGMIEQFASCATAVYLAADRGSLNPLGCTDQLVEASYKASVIEFSTGFNGELMKSAINDGVAAQRAQTDKFGVPPELIARGWGGAGIWYNKIAEWNGSLYAAAINIPTPSKPPSVMQLVQEQRLSHDQNVDAMSRFDPFLENYADVTFEKDYERQIAQALSAVYKYWNTPTFQDSDAQVSGNIFFDTLNAMFGSSGLFDMRKNINVHPLAQLVGLGKGILDSSIRNLMTALAFSFLGGMGEILSPHLGGALGSISGMFIAMATVGLTIGFSLYYILPFLPFMYFFFAVGNWVKGIFEAMVGAPLWALAHLRIDGEGFAGEQATNGYFLVLEIFLRPILCVFGLLAGLAIFSAMARTLNGVFDLVVMNLTGYDCSDCLSTGAGGGAPAGGPATPSVGLEFKRNVVDELFYTVVYAIIVYMLATSCFKMVDQVPEQILRWMGAGVSTFGANVGDSVGALEQYAVGGGYTISTQAIGAAQQGAKVLGNITGSPLSLLKTRDQQSLTGAKAAEGIGMTAKDPKKG